MIEYFVPNASTYAGEIDTLFSVITWTVGFWFVLVEIVIFYLIFKFRKKKDGQKAQYITGEKHSESKWVHWPHYAVIACDVVLIGMTMVAWVHIKQDLPAADDKIRVIGQQWSWIFVHSGPDGKLDTADDISTVNELHVKVDTVYHFELQSKDVLHNFSVPVFRLKQDTVPGRTITGWFEPTKTGEYDIQCAEMCGIGHGIMASRIKILNAADYNQWMASNAPRSSDEALAMAQHQTTSKLGGIKWIQP